MEPEEHNNGIDRIVREKFRSFESDPPVELWEAVRKNIPAAPPVSDHRINWADWTGRLWPHHKLYPALSLLALLVVAALILINREETHNLNGTAYLANKTLSCGTAFLFRVDDTQVPFDSVSFAGKTKLDKSGKFSFSNLPPARYMIRIFSPGDSGFLPGFHLGYSGDQLRWDLAEVIDLGSDIENYIIHVPELIPRE